MSILILLLRQLREAVPSVRQLYGVLGTRQFGVMV